MSSRYPANDPPIERTGGVRVLTWNLFHGRADPPAGRPLLHEFATTLARWEWDVALLQEVPPWWPPALATACGARAFSVPTSRNALPGVRRAIAARRPDLLKSNGGGANAILVRGTGPVTAHARLRLRACPERRVLHAVRLGPRATWVANVHCQKGSWEDAAGLAIPGADLARCFAALDRWFASDGDPAQEPDVMLGGDLNLPADAVDAALPDGWARIATSGPDHVLARGRSAAGSPSRPDRGTLSDHAALMVTARAVAGRPAAGA
ncbi:MAG: endonuclease/exonuclease/phosphatase family protein [Solirubrobacteraceae bacterium]